MWHLNPWPNHFWPSFNYQFFLTMASNYSRSLNKLSPCTSLITFTNGIDDVVFAKLKPPHNNVSIGSSNHLFPSLPNMWLPPSPSLKKKPLASPNNSKSFTHSQGTYIQYYRTPWDLCHSTKTKHGCLTPRMDCLVPHHTTIHTPHNQLCMVHLHIHQYMEEILTIPLPLINNHTLLPFLHP